MITKQLVESTVVLVDGVIAGGVASLVLIGDGRRRGSRVGDGMTLVDRVVAFDKRTLGIRQLGPARKSVQGTRRACM